MPLQRNKKAHVTTFSKCLSLHNQEYVPEKKTCTFNSLTMFPFYNWLSWNQRWIHLIQLSGNVLKEMHCAKVAYLSRVKQYMQGHI